MIAIAVAIGIGRGVPALVIAPTIASIRIPAAGPGSPHGPRSVETVVFAASRAATAAARQDGHALTVDGARRFQTIDGFGVNANPASWNGGRLTSALDLLADQLNATVWRVIVESTENWETRNDNSDPNVFDWAYYNALYSSAKFQNVWGVLDYLKRKAVPVIMVNVMGVVPAWMGGDTIANEDEFVEMVTSFLYYARNTKGLRIDIISPLNETDLGAPEGPAVDSTEYVRILDKLVTRLHALGLGSIRVLGPDTAYVTSAVSNYIPAMLKNPAVMAQIDHFGLHNYHGDSGNAAGVIRRSRYPSRNFWMTEWASQCPGCDTGTSSGDEWGFAKGTVENLFNHLRDGAAAALVYDAYDSFYEHHGSVGYWGLLSHDPTSGTYAPKKRFYAALQVFRFVSPGSIRIGATASGPGLQAQAFHHAGSGRTTIVGRNAAPSAVTVRGSLTNLPPIGRLELYQTTGTRNFERGADVAVSDGEFSVTIAPDSIFTLTSAGDRQLSFEPTSRGPGQR